MALRRLLLDAIFMAILAGIDPTYEENVYFQSPQSTIMSYPCIKYEQTKLDTKYANGLPYLNKKGYKVTIIDADPDSVISDEVAKLQLVSWVTHYNSNDLNHFVYTIYF